MDAAVQALGRLAQEAQRLAAGGGGGSAGRPLPASAQFLRPGGEPCPAECVEGLQDLWCTPPARQTCHDHASP